MASMASMSPMNTMGSTSAAAAASATASPAMAMGHDMGGMGGGKNCKISMLWNWNTIDACFLASSWHITSAGMFASSCIGVIAFVMLLEFVRRVQREYDQALHMQAQLRQTTRLVELGHTSPAQGSGGKADGAKVSMSVAAHSTKGSDSDSSEAIHQQEHGIGAKAPQSRIVRILIDSGERKNAQWASIIQQTIRSFIYTCQFAAAYFIMLLAMYYNGYIIISILIGAFLGHFVFSWDLAKGGVG